MTTRTDDTKQNGPKRRRALGPTDAHREKINEVFRLMVEEGLSTNAACKRVTLRWQTLMDWCEAAPENAEKYARARIQLLERMAHEIHQIADTPVEGVITTIKSDGGVEEKRADMIEHRRLQIESRKWLLARLMPQKYGDKQHIQHSGSVGLESLVAGEDKGAEGGNEG
jgi:hypothetical protein